MITSDYESHTKDELLDECEARKIEGVSSASLKADIVAALTLDDESKPEEAIDPDGRWVKMYERRLRLALGRVQTLPEHLRNKA